MKKLQLLAVLSLPLLLSGCLRERADLSAAGGYRKIVPQLEKEASISEASVSAENGEELSIQAKVPLDPDEALIQMENVNLDLDPADEQILVAKKKQDSEAPIKITAVDFDPVRNGYVRTWEGLTHANNVRLFSLSFNDLVGDHNLEIVCRGLTNRGELTLDVFRKASSPNGLGLYFSPICGIVADGSIEIMESERSEGYQMGQKNGISFPIVAYTQDRESANPLDRLKHSYYWQYQQNKYVLSAVEKLPGAVVEEKQLAELFASSSPATFKQFLAGPWALSGSPDKENSDKREIILFQPEEGRLNIFSKDVQESYEWKASFRTFSNRLLILAENESIPSISKRFQIEVKSINTIEVAVVGAEQWDRSFGTYVKLNDELQKSLVSERQEGVQLSDLELRGVFRSGEGIEVIFEPPYFTWIEKDKQYSGGFTLFNLNQTVLMLKNREENGFSRTTKTYIVEYTEKKEKNRLSKTLVLAPGRIGIKGVEPLPAPKIILEQVSVVE